MQTTKLYDKEKAIEFYEERYANHYMDEWPAERKDRILNLIKSLPLPEKGKALDFGCGNGVFTGVLKKALPDWEVYGCDISAGSISNAKRRFPECHFFVSNDDINRTTKFDLIFSHHVLEHVYNIQKSVEEIAGYLLPNASMFHILPCGNPGSFEHYVASLRKDGIDEKLENRLFHEDEGHLRRLTSAQFVNLFAPYGYTLRKEFYAHHKKAFEEWITKSTLSYIKFFADPGMGKDLKSTRILKQLRRRLLFQFFLRFPSSIFLKAKDPNKPAVRYLILALGWIPYLIGLPFYNRLVRQAREEWRNSNQDKSGGEMYLFFSKTDV